MTHIDVDRVLDCLRARRIEAHLRFLASPLLEGRGAGSRGGELAEGYIRSVFAGAGLQGAVDGGYRQEVEMVGLTPDPDLVFTRQPGEMIRPRYRDQYVLEAGLPVELARAESELVFVGFGINAPEYGWNDYAGLDVGGKVVLVRVNDPGTPDRPDFFEGRALTYYGRWTYKLEEAARQGAAGVLLIHTDASAGYGWNVVRSSNTGEQFDLAGTPKFPLQVRGWVAESVARQLLDASSDGADRLLEESARLGFRARPLGVRVAATVRSQIREVRGANVIGLLPAADAEHAAQPVIVMAHHDHLGTGVDESGQTVIYPGASDNASGVALLLALAEAVCESGVRLPRPLLFLASTAEESGLLGSEWYVRHPLFPLAGTAAVLNVDGANLHGPTRDIAPLGVDRSSLGGVVRAAAAAEALEVAPEQHPEQGMFFRQDHFPFARAGIPGIAFDHGLTYSERPEGWGEQMYEEFNTRHYHQPTDAFREDFDYRGAVQQGRVMLRTAIEVASAARLPDWSAVSAFARPKH